MRRTSRSMLLLAVFILAAAVGVVGGTTAASADTIPPAPTAEAQFLVAA